MVLGLGDGAGGGEGGGVMGGGKNWSSGMGGSRKIMRYLYIGTCVRVSGRLAIPPFQGGRVLQGLGWVSCIG